MIIIMINMEAYFYHDISVLYHDNLYHDNHHDTLIEYHEKNFSILW